MGAHVNFNHNAHNWKGSMMMNLVGFTWRGYGDGKYRIVDATCPTGTLWSKRKCSDPETEAQRRIIVHATMLSVLDILKVTSGLEIASKNEFHAICYVPVRYWDTQAPIPPENQQHEIWKLRSAMSSAGRPMEEHGFDFSLGYLKFESTKLRGSVGYIDYVKQHCNLP